MENLLKFAELLALLSASALCAYLIVVLMRLNKLLEMLQKDFSELNKHLKPVLENLHVVTERLKSISIKVDDQVNLFKGTLESFKQMSDNVVRFEERVQQRLEEPIHRITALIGNIIGRLGSFIGIRSSSSMG